MRIGHNIPALSSYNASSHTNALPGRSVSRLSTGLRISSAADDAAGLAISEKMRAQYRGIDRAERNAQDGISMIQTAEGALDASVVVRGAARAGNFRVVVIAAAGGRGQVQKSNIFTESRTYWIDTDGDGSSDEKVTEMKTASRGSVLSDITAFYDENGRFLLEDPQQPRVQRVHQRCPQ